MDRQETKRIDDFLANPELTDEALAEATGGLGSWSGGSGVFYELSKLKGKRYSELPETTKWTLQIFANATSEDGSVEFACKVFGIIYDV